MQDLLVDFEVQIYLALHFKLKLLCKRRSSWRKGTHYYYYYYYYKESRSEVEGRDHDSGGFEGQGMAVQGAIF